MRSLVILVVSAVGVIGCHQPAAAPPAVGQQFDLELVVDTPRSILPSIERAIAPVTDTGTLRLTIERVAGDSALGSHSMPSRHFWPAFLSVTREFSITPEGTEWVITLGYRITDAGATCRGPVSAGGMVVGRWQSEGSEGYTGRCVLRPAS